MDKRKFIRLVRDWKAEEVNAALGRQPELVNFTDERGKTPLQHCSEINAVKTGLDVNRSIETAAALLAAGADINAVRIIVDEGEEFHATALWYAVAWGSNSKLAGFLLEKGADPENCMWAATWNQDQTTAQALLKHGAKIDPVFHGETPLLQIIMAKRFALLRWLVDHGADINFQDQKGYSPLHYAVKRDHTLAQVVMLLKLGANPNLSAKDGHSPITLAMARKKPRLVELLTAFSQTGGDHVGREQSVDASLV
jgi:ankyrin repeat protein